LFAYRFQVKKKQFFHNFMTIMSFGVFGVFISGAIVSAGRFLLIR
jgi:NhaP-type Na+/H+ or K+/H+ antiporter